MKIRRIYNKITFPDIKVGDTYTIKTKEFEHTVKVEEGYSRKQIAEEFNKVFEKHDFPYIAE